MKKDYRLSNANLNILNAVYTLSEEGVEATLDGLAMLIGGSYSEETLPYLNSAAYGYLASVSSKRIKARIHALIRRDYLFLDYDEESDTQFLLLTNKSRSLNLKMLGKKPLKDKKRVCFRQKEK